MSASALSGRPPVLVDSALCLPPKLAAYVARLREAGPYIPPKPAKPRDFANPSQQLIAAGDGARYSADYILTCVTDVTGVRRIHLRSHRQQPALSRARQSAAWLCRQHTCLSYPNIGRWLGDRDHTSIIYACRRVDAVIASQRVVETDDPAQQAARLLAAFEAEALQRRPR